MARQQQVTKRAYDHEGKLVETLRYTTPVTPHTRWMIQKFEYRHFIEAFNRTIKSTYQEEQR